MTKKDYRVLSLSGRCEKPAERVRELNSNSAGMARPTAGLVETLNFRYAEFFCYLMEFFDALG